MPESCNGNCSFCRSQTDKANNDIKALVKAKPKRFVLAGPTLDETLERIITGKTNGNEKIATWSPSPPPTSRNQPRLRGPYSFSDIYETIVAKSEKNGSKTR